jgi:hypothetical protein
VLCAIGGVFYRGGAIVVAIERAAGTGTARRSGSVTTH